MGDVCAGRGGEASSAGLDLEIDPDGCGLVRSERVIREPQEDARLADTAEDEGARQRELSTLTLRWWCATRTVVSAVLPAGGLGRHFP